MTDTPDPQGAPQGGDGQAAQQQKISNKIVAQYIRDVSFENVLAQKSITGDVAPEISVQVNLDARKRQQENQYEVITKLIVTSKTKSSGDTLFVMELEYAGVFQIEGVPDEQMHPYLLIECPRLTFPFVRRIVSDMTRDGGFPPLNLENIDFLELYRNEIRRRAQSQQGQQGGDSTPPTGTA